MKDLTHANNQKVKAALAAAKEKGDATWVRPLLEAYAGRKEDALREEMRTMLGSMKVSAAEQTFLDALVDPNLSHVKADILGFLWSCGFTCDGLLSRVADAACEGDFQQAFEGVTLLEQVESVSDEKDLLEAQVVVGEAIQADAKEDIRPFLEAMRTHLALLYDGMQ